MYAKIYGIEIYFDKEGSIKIDDDVITFGDGSTVNLKTRLIKNRGKGYVSFKRPTDAVEAEPTVKTFEEITRVIVDDLEANSLTIEPSDSNVVTVTASGHNLDLVSAEVNNGELQVKNVKSPEKYQIEISGMHTPSLREALASIIKGLATNTISIAIGETQPDVTISVPAEVEVQVNYTDCPITIGDLTSDITLNHTGSNDVEIKTAANLVITNDDDARIEVDKVSGTLAVSSGGSGSVTIQEVISDKIILTATDDGDIKVNAITTEGDVTLLSDSSYDITIGDLTAEKVIIRSTDQGSITVDKLECQSLNATIRYDGNIDINSGTIKGLLNVDSFGEGDFSFDGTADDAELFSDDDGSISVKKVVQRPLTKQRGEGQIEVENW